MKNRSVRISISIVGALILGITLSAWKFDDSPKPDSTAANASAHAAADSITHVHMQNVDFYVDPEIPLNIRRLNGTMRASRSSWPATRGPMRTEGSKFSCAISTRSGRKL